MRVEKYNLKGLFTQKIQTCMSFFPHDFLKNIANQKQKLDGLN